MRNQFLIFPSYSYNQPGTTIYLNLHLHTYLFSEHEVIKKIIGNIETKKSSTKHEITTMVVLG